MTSLRSARLFCLVSVALAAPVVIPAQAMDHSAMHKMDSTQSMMAPPAQAAFATIADIVRKLKADSTTDWSKVNIEALRQHLIDIAAFRRTASRRSRRRSTPPPQMVRRRRRPARDDEAVPSGRPCCAPRRRQRLWLADVRPDSLFAGRFRVVTQTYPPFGSESRRNRQATARPTELLIQE